MEQPLFEMMFMTPILKFVMNIIKTLRLHERISDDPIPITIKNHQPEQLHTSQKTRLN